MFIGYYELENNEPYFNIYYKNKSGIEQWKKETFSGVYNIEILDFTIKGKTYEEKKENARHLAIEYQNNFSFLSWSCAEIMEITSYFEKIGKRYGLLKEFKENAIC